MAQLRCRTAGLHLLSGQSSSYPEPHIMDVDRVLAWFADGALLRPDPSRPTTVSLGRALAALGGAGIELDEPARTVRDVIDEARHIILVLADGLGMELVDSLPETSFLRSHLVMEMDAVFPSSTAPALTSLATGVWPGQHGLPGWFVYLPDLDLQVVSLPFRDRFSTRSAESAGLEPARLFDWQPLLPAYDRKTWMLMPGAISRSAYTRSISGGARIEGFNTLDDAVSQLVRRFAGEPEPSYTYFYYSKVDSTAHDHGPLAAATHAAALRLDEALALLHSHLKGAARIVVSSDHGGIEVDAARKIVIRPEDRAMAMLRTPPSGEPRAPIFHVRPGGGHDFADAFRAGFGQHFALLSLDEVAELGLLGPGGLSAAARARFGDYLALSAGGEALIYGPDKGYLEMAGFHGGLDPREMRIPLIVA